MRSSEDVILEYFALLSGTASVDATDLLTENFVFRHPPLTGPEGVIGREVFLETVLWPTRVAFPGMSFMVEDVVVDGDRAFARWTMDAVHEGTYMNVPPTGNAVRVHGMNCVHLEDARVAETWAARDNLGLLRQLGQVI